MITVKEGCFATPLQELLRHVPKDFRLTLNTDWDAERLIHLGLHHIPIGKLCHEAAELIAHQAAEIERLRGGLTDAKAKLKTQFQFVCDFDGRLATPDYAKYQATYQAVRILEQTLTTNKGE